MHCITNIRDERSINGAVSFEASPFVFAREFLSFDDDDDDDDGDCDDTDTCNEEEEQEVSIIIYDKLNQGDVHIEKRLMAKHIESGRIKKVHSFIENEMQSGEIFSRRSTYMYSFQNNTSSSLPFTTTTLSTTNTALPAATSIQEPYSETRPTATITDRRHRRGNSCPLVEVEDLLRSSPHFADDLQLLSLLPAATCRTSMKPHAFLKKQQAVAA